MPAFAYQQLINSYFICSPNLSRTPILYMFPAWTERVGHTLGEFSGRTQHKLAVACPMRLFESDTDRIFLRKGQRTFSLHIFCKGNQLDPSSHTMSNNMGISRMYVRKLGLDFHSVAC